MSKLPSQGGNKYVYSYLLCVHCFVVNFEQVIAHGYSVKMPDV